jgi:hypothetical protein
LRPAVLRRNGSFGSDSEAGSRFAERLLTVVATCRQQGCWLLAFLVVAREAALRGSPPPSLLPAPQGGADLEPEGCLDDLHKIGAVREANIRAGPTVSTL